MEYIIFRVLRLIEREIDMYQKLYQNLIEQNNKIVNDDVLESFSNILEQKEMLNLITRIEDDIKDEIYELADILDIKSEEPNITLIVNVLQHKYPKLCHYFNDLSNKINDIFTKIEEINYKNIQLLQQYGSLWKDIFPRLNTYNSVKEYEVDHSESDVSINELELKD